MKSFRKQFWECIGDGTAKNFKLREKEKFYPRPNTKKIKFIEMKTAYFCNKYMKRCSSVVCKKERELL